MIAPAGLFYLKALICMHVPRTNYFSLVLMAFLLVRAALSQDTAVNTVAPSRLNVAGAKGSGNLALYTEADLSSSQPGTVRAIIVFHGLHRNAEGYLRDLKEARSRAGGGGKNTLLIAPQFLNEDDTRAHKVGAEVLRWHRSQWEAGEPAVGPAAISSYEAIDAILNRLSDRSRFPNLQEIVLAGHSGGGQIVQRYAVVGHQITAVEKAGIALRYVVANPSSYVYFDEERPVTAVLRGCKQFNAWKFGLQRASPYLGAPSATELETNYISRSVTYLLGGDDDDPNGPDIDKTCAAEAQGMTRLERGTNYFKYLRSRHSTGLEHRVLLVPGVAHNAQKMFTSACGIYSLFETGSCKAKN
jgi:pimeloyl-ACP methyl ester carboxylesterase